MPWRRVRKLNTSRAVVRGGGDGRAAAAGRIFLTQINQGEPEELVAAVQAVTDITTPGVTEPLEQQILAVAAVVLRM